MNIIERMTEKPLLIVKQVFIKEFGSSLTSGRKRINPMPRPNSAKIAKRLNVEINTEVKPIVSMSYTLAAIIQKKNPNTELNPAPKIK